MLRTVASLMLVLAWSGGTAALAAEPAAIAPGVWLLRGEFVPGQQPDGNSVVLRGRKGLIVIDSGRHPAHTQRILDLAAGQKQPIAALVNTHWHLDHVSGNPRLRATHPDLTVYGSDAIDAALSGFLARSRAQLQQMLTTETDATQRDAMQAEIARIDAGAALRPDRIVSAAQSLKLAGRRVDLGFVAHGVTAGDVWLFDRKSRVLVAGDLVTLPAPFLDTACAPRWQAAFAELDRIDFEILVPGHGPAFTRAQFQTYRRAFDNLLSCAAGKGEAAACVDGWREDAKPLLTDQSPDLTRGLVGYYVQQRLRGPGATQDCPAASATR